MRFSEDWSRLSFSEVQELIHSARKQEVETALQKASAGLGLNLLNFASLLSPSATPYLEEMARISQALTLTRFGRTIQLYAPLYLSNACKNVCTYCGFSANNRLKRKTLNPLEIENEALALQKLGIEHVLLVTGESNQVSTDYLAAALKQLRPRFANLAMEVQPQSTEDYAALGKEGLSSVLVYQETYDAKAYSACHPSGPKKDILYRLDTPDRLGLAGIKKIGLGALYGLSDWRADSYFVGLHLRHLEKRYWKTRYSVSFPRLRPHEGLQTSITPFDEQNLIQAACAFRMLSLELELALSTRESEYFRKHAYKLGFTHLSAGSKTNPGGYAGEDQSLEQFSIDDGRSAADIAEQLRGDSYTPVWKDWDPSFDGHTTLK